MYCSCFGWIFSCTRLVDERQRFDEADENKDGVVSIDEFRQYYRTTRGRDPCFREWVQFHAADFDNDGMLSIHDVMAHNATSKLMT